MITNKPGDPCKAFIKRIKPQGVNMVCRKPTTHELIAIHVSGKEILHGRGCEYHMNKSLEFYTDTDEWQVVVREIAAEVTL